MKRIVSVISACLIMLTGTAQTVQVTTEKTISLVFPFAIRHVDRGTKDVLVQPVKEADNILLVKAGVKNFIPTNLSVITTDGSVYAFTVTYEPQVTQMIYEVPAKRNQSLETYANMILDNRRNTWHVKAKSWNINSQVNGIYIRDNTIYYQLRLTNHSPIDYDINCLRFYIRDKKKTRRTAVQEIEVKPLFLAGNARQVKAGDKNTVVVALEKFTVPDAKYLAIEIQEQNGGRHLLMKVHNKHIIRAVKLPYLQ